MPESLPAQLVKTKQHFLILDGMRGVAAISVVIYHFMELVAPDYSKNFIGHGHLAVDFFFCLSGFVIAYAYDSRMEALGFAAFMKLRLIRLHPLVLLGAVSGLLFFIVDPFSDLHTSYSTGKKLLMLLASCTMIPWPNVPERYNNFFFLNPPTWSLFWEYVANIVYALFLFRIKNKLLWVLTGVAAVILCIESYKSGYLGVGWGGDNFWGGGVRIFFSFLAGMLTFRLRWTINSGVGFIGMSMLLFLAFVIPFSDATNFFVEPLVIIFYFPLLVALGAGARLSPLFTKACQFLGNVSYPLYMVHYPFIWIFMSYLQARKPDMTTMTLITIFGTALLTLLAYFVLRFFDEPVRKWLKDKWIKSA